jgi:catechol 2,3-dioxygenase-like lactoylglutathione lyase family enzyme
MFGNRNFYFTEKISVGVRNLERAVAWYREKLGLKLTPLKAEDFDPSLEKDGEIGLALVVIPQGQSAANIPGHPILYQEN